jgi:hypothetical protein
MWLFTILGDMLECGALLPARSKPFLTPPTPRRRMRERPMSGSRRIILPITIGLVLTTPAVAQQAKDDPAALEFFEKKIRPVLVEHCHKCHAADAQKIKGGLRLDDREALLKGGETGPVVVPGSLEKSRLIEAIGYKNVELQMPPKGKLPDTVIADLTAWVKMGAPWPKESRNKAAAAADGFDLQKRKRSHWAWQPIGAHQPPRVQNAAWVKSPIDAFILARLEAQGLKPAAPADRRTLLRRLSFDLIGLPPSADEIDAFLNDSSPDAFEKVVDRLLGSPRFGERWARHWLDLVRYAESRGHELDYTTPNAYQYRDYVIRALNADVPYDQFVTEHIAGDLLEQPRVDPKEGCNESILGTGFWFLGEEVHSPVDPRQDEADRFDNRVDVMTKTFLGLTVACARCHDHKFDAISTKDYYALFGFLESSGYRLVRFDSMDHNRRIAVELDKLHERSRSKIQRALAAAYRPAVEQLADHLLAAREAMAAEPDFDCLTAHGFTPAYWKKLTSIAEARHLDSERLASWTVHLVRVCQDANDPFHAWAKAAADVSTREPQRFGEVLRSIVAEMKWRKCEAGSALKNAEIIVDYGRCAPAEWMPDDSAFGTMPQQAGDPRVTGDKASPHVRLLERGAAVYDGGWDALRPAPGSENDPSAIGRLVRAGRTIRTPSFTLTAGKLFYLVKGVGQAYAAVDQHTLINGPLHAQLVQPIKTGGRYQWVDHDLTAYEGQPAHVEFTASGGADFEIARVVRSERAPGPVEPPNDMLLSLLDSPQGRSLPEVASGYQRLFANLIERLSEDRIRGATDAAAATCLVNWMTAHPELFFGDKKACKPLVDVTASYLAEEKAVRSQIKEQSRLALAMLDGNGVDERVFIRGASKALGEVVPRRFLEALAGAERLRVKQGSGRLELARQMTDSAVNPLLPRVMVNRIWHHLFGRGILASVDNFGVLGEVPTHPELLDFLAEHFVREGWSIKRLIRQLVLSSTYQMSSRPGDGSSAIDPQNLLLQRMRVRRLEGEAIRDAMLAVSGRLDLRMYGPSVPVHLTPFLDGRGRPASGPLDGDGRRSVYLAVRRNFLSPLLLTFDTPIPFSTVGRRTISNVPAQALILLNDPFVHQQAETWARRTLARPDTAAERITSMYVSAFGRPPTESERAACLDFLEEQARLRHADLGQLPAWKDLAHTLFNVKEFIYLD